jgi:hypothetical protein
MNAPLLLGKGPAIVCLDSTRSFKTISEIYDHEWDKRRDMGSSDLYRDRFGVDDLWRRWGLEGDPMIRRKGREKFNHDRDFEDIDHGQFGFWLFVIALVGSTVLAIYFA